MKGTHQIHPTPNGAARCSGRPTDTDTQQTSGPGPQAPRSRDATQQTCATALCHVAHSVFPYLPYYYPLLASASSISQSNQPRITQSSTIYGKFSSPILCVICFSFSPLTVIHFHFLFFTKASFFFPLCFSVFFGRYYRIIGTHLSLIPLSTYLVKSHWHWIRCILSLITEYLAHCAIFSIFNYFLR